MDLPYFLTKSFTNHESTIELGEYEDCHFEQYDFKGIKLNDFQFVDCFFKECDLSNLSLHNARFQQCSFKDCKLLGLHFDSCNTFGFEIHVNQCIVDHASFSHMNLKKCSFIESSLKGVEFEGADLSGITMINCSLGNANFLQTDLSNTDLSRSINFDINPESNNIRSVKVSSYSINGFLRKFNLEIID